jgi:hypothetical protein
VNFQAKLPRAVLVFLVAICLLGVRAQTTHLASPQTRAGLDAAESAITLNGGGLAKRISSSQLSNVSPDAKLFDRFLWLQSLSTDSKLLAPDLRVPLHSAVVLPTSGRSPPSSTL